jgi:hypothetical protein
VVGSTQNRALCVKGDQDWVTFTVATAGTYRIETLNLARHTDTYLDLYRGAALTRIAFDDDDGNEVFASLIVITLTQPDVYYVKVTYYNNFTGHPRDTYDLRITLQE